MKVGHLVAYVSEDGAFGGPIAVALGQARELAKRGHTVSFLAGWDGVVDLDAQGLQQKLFPVLRPFGSKLTSIVSPGLFKHIWRSGRDYDLLHIHLGRDLSTSIAAAVALFRGVPFVAQTHGMVMPDDRWHAKLFDTILMRRLLASSACILVLSDKEETGVSRVSRAKANTKTITNGIRAIAHARVGPRPNRPRVVFLARLHPRKRVMTFAAAAAKLLAAGTLADFLIYGPDEGDLQELLSFMASHDIEGLAYMGTVAPGESTRVLASASVFVLPSVGEVVPMTVLEAMAVGTPVVLTSDCAMAPKLKDSEAAVVTDGTVEQIADAINKLLNDQVYAEVISNNADHLVKGHYSLPAIACTLESTYDEALNTGG